MPRKHLSDEEYEHKAHGVTVSTRVIRIGLWKAVTIISTAVLGTAGASIWGTLRVANTIPFRVDAIERDITEIKQTFMPLDLSLEKWKTNEDNHLKVEKKLEIIESKIDSIRNLIK